MAADLIGAGNAATVPNGHLSRPGGPTLTKPEEAQAFVDARIAEGSDFIKIVSETFQYHARNIPTLSDETFKAVVDAAHKRGMLVVAHVEQPDRARRAILAGVDITVHMPPYDAPNADYAQLFRAHHAFQNTNLITFAPGSFRHEIATDPDIKPYLPTWMLKRLSEAMPNADAVHAFSVAHFKQIVSEKVPYAAGTDSENYLLHVEMDIMVRDGGVAPIEALKSATSTPASIYPHLEDRGRIAPGLRADLLLVNGDPTKDIHSTRKIDAVWVRGRTVDREAFRKRQLAVPEPPPRAPAQPAAPTAR